MRKTLLFVVAIAFMAIRSSATVHTVTVTDFQFTPSSMSVALGDTIEWVWGGGTTMAHTTTSTSVPSGANTWNNPISSSNTTFTYTPTVAGTYQYNCAIHPTLMSGSFTVASHAAVPSAVANAVSVYPNPASSDLHLQFADAAPTSVALINILGSKVYSAELFTRETSLNVKDLPNGSYIVNIAHGGLVYKHELLIVH